MMIQSGGSVPQGIEMSKGGEPHQVEFFNRLANIPVVQSAYEYASGAYSKAKDLSPTLIKKTWTNAENTFTFAAQYAVPVVQSIEGTRVAHAVDQLACRTLDKTEASLPVMTKTPDEMVKETRLYITNKIQPAQQCLSSVTDLMLNTLLGRMSLDSTTFSSTTVQDYIDYVIPPGLGEESKATETPADSTQKIMWSLGHGTDILFKVQRRLSNRVHGILNEPSLDALGILRTVLDLVEWAQFLWSEILMAAEMPAKLNQLANFYRDPNGDNEEARRPLNAVEDAVYLTNYMVNRVILIIRDALSIATELADSQPVRALRLKLYLTLEAYLQFASRLARDSFGDTDDLIKEDFRCLLNTIA